MAPCCCICIQSTGIAHAHCRHCHQEQQHWVHAAQLPLLSTVCSTVRCWPLPKEGDGRPCVQHWPESTRMAVQRGLLGRVEVSSEPLHKGWSSGMWRWAERSGLDQAAGGGEKGEGMMLLEQEPEKPLFPNCGRSTSRRRLSQ